MGYLQNFAALLLGSAVLHAVIILLSFRPRVNAPRVGKRPGLLGLWRARAHFYNNGKALTKEGYDRYKSSVYWIQTGDMERLVISNRYIDELRKYPSSYLDSKMAVVERNLGWYNGVDIILKSTAHVDVCHTQLVQNLDILPRVFESELEACFRDRDIIHFYNATGLILDMVNRVTAKILVGEPLCYDAKWLQTSLETTVNTGLLCRYLQRYPAFLRPFMNYFAPARMNLDRNHSVAQNLLSKRIKGRNRGDKNKDILQWLMDTYEEKGPEISFLTNQIQFVATAAVRSTAASLLNTMYDLLSFPQYQTLLRQEIREAIAEHGGWSLAAVENMKRLDSFIKESQRMNHHILLSFNRKVQRTIKLHDGTTLHPGTFISTPAYWGAMDPAIFPNADEFQPWRWFELRSQAERENKNTVPYLASSISLENLFWGYGRNACPGRFMAAAEIKLLVAWMLHHFDITFPEGQDSRPESLFVDERVVPDPNQDIGFQLRQDNDKTY
ncbi:cytochrome P450 [Lindgomyces ingoldianus]|uniref:Cytochrome P450 n=1 Tax=Lindgomyces ingoldianus TaxID=673940 RepID=A0ACB6Q9Q3_9PLEO|nr:cytochrome P450 [Lindgomyces ingoldianus]KAF2462876.1 cytochrome P450 [Lindgomyces ingoldianus]